MAQTNDAHIQTYGGSLLALNLLSGASTTLLLSSLGATNSTTVTENNGTLAVGETVVLADGSNATVLGSGTAQPGVELLGLIVATGTAVPLVVLESSDGQILFLYPDGTPNLLGAVALVVTASATSYAFPGAAVCFSAGTLIETSKGSCPVELLAVGDLVMTADEGLQPVRWIGKATLGPTSLLRNEHLRPIRIAAGALGKGLPTCDLLLSPQHRVLIESPVAERMFGTPSVLIAAKHLCSIDGIKTACDLTEITYVHILFDRHQIVFSNGAPTEALLPGPEALRSVGSEGRAEILELFPELDAKGAQPKPARFLIPGRRGRKLAERHSQNHRPLLGGNRVQLLQDEVNK